MAATPTLLGTPAVRQIISRLNKNEREEQALIDKIAGSCRKYDHKGKGKLSADDYFNVIKLQNGIHCCSKQEVKQMLSALPADKEGLISIDDFLHVDIHSEDAFKVIMTYICTSIN